MDRKNKPGFISRKTMQLANHVHDAQHKLSLKQRAQILSRRIVMGRTHHSLFRTLIAVILVLALVIVGGKLQTSAWNAGEPTAVPVSDHEVQLSFVGDVMMGRYVASFGEKMSYSELFRDSKTLWDKSALVFANLESAVIKQGERYDEADKNLKLSASQEAIQMAAEAGIDAVSLANDHVGDYGREGVRHTIEAMQEYGMEYAGAGAEREEAGAYRLLEADGLTVGFVACTQVAPDQFAATKDGYGVCPTSYTNLYENVFAASTNSDFVVVYVHWGNENDLTVTETQRKIAYRLIDSGADIVIGSHPNILQEVEQYKNGIVFYSLGSFISDEATRQARNTTMVQLNVDKNTGDGYFTLIPMRINDFHPYETTNRFYVSQIHQSLLKALPASAYSVTEDGRIQIPMKLYQPQETAVIQTTNG